MKWAGRFWRPPREVLWRCPSRLVERSEPTKRADKEGQSGQDVRAAPLSLSVRQPEAIVLAQLVICRGESAHERRSAIGRDVLDRSLCSRNEGRCQVGR